MYRDGSADELLYAAFNGRVFAFAKMSGAVVWQKQFDQSGEVCLHVEDELVFAACTNVVRAFDAGTGVVRWRTVLPLTAQHGARMLVDASGIYVSLGGEIACLERDGTVRWSDPLKGTGWGPPTLAVRGRSATRQTTRD